MKKQFFSVYLCFFCFTCAFSPGLQAQSQLSGMVKDAAGKPLPAANVLLLNAADSSLVHGMLASEEGAYQFENVAPGSFLLSCTMIGYIQGFSQPFLVEDNSTRKEMDPMVLQENNTLLSEVQVVAKRPFLEQKIDRTVVNVSNSITNAGSNALEVLQRSPGVQVNRLTKSISLFGKEGIVIMINGKISRLPSDAVVQMLESMNAAHFGNVVRGGRAVREECATAIPWAARRSRWPWHDLRDLHIQRFSVEAAIEQINRPWPARAKARQPLGKR